MISKKTLNQPRIKNVWDDPATRAIQALGYEGFTLQAIGNLLNRSN